MLKIHREQETLVAEKAFVDKVEGFIAEDLLRRRVSAEEKARLPLRAMIEHALVVARGYGWETQRDLMLFALNMITINPGWHRQPHIQAILQDKGLTPPARREKLLVEVSEEEWDEAGAMVDEDEYWTRALPANSGGVASDP
jgi:hypothetical protein